MPLPLGNRREIAEVERNLAGANDGVEEEEPHALKSLLIELKRERFEVWCRLGGTSIPIRRGWEGGSTPSPRDSLSLSPSTSLGIDSWCIMFAFVIVIE